MAATLWNVDWPNANSQRKYPISEVATGMDVSGTYRLPDDFLVDAAIAFDMGDVSLIGRYLLMSISTFGESVRAVFGYMPVGGTTPVAIGSVTVSKSTHTEYSGYCFDGGDPHGRVTIGNLTNVVDNGGHFEFDLEGGRLEPCVCKPSLGGVRSIRVNSGTVSKAYTGDVDFVAGTNFRFTNQGNGAVLSAGFQEGMVVYRDAVANAPLGDPVRSINNQFPDAGGNINLLGDNCLTVQSFGSNGLQLQDRCSESCCGCTDLSRVLADLNQLKIQALGMESRLQELENGFLTAMSTILASKAQNLDVEGRNPGLLSLPTGIVPPINPIRPIGPTNPPQQPGGGGEGGSGGGGSVPDPVAIPSLTGSLTGRRITSISTFTLNLTLGATLGTGMIPASSCSINVTTLGAWQASNITVNTGGTVGSISVNPDMRSFGFNTASMAGGTTRTAMIQLTIRNWSAPLDMVVNWNGRSLALTGYAV